MHKPRPAAGTLGSTAKHRAHAPTHPPPKDYPPPIFSRSAPPPLRTRSRDPKARADTPEGKHESPARSPARSPANPKAENPPHPPYNNSMIVYISLYI